MERNALHGDLSGRAQDRLIRRASIDAAVQPVFGGTKGQSRGVQGIRTWRRHPVNVHGRPLEIERIERTDRTVPGRLCHAFDGVAPVFDGVDDVFRVSGAVGGDLEDEIRLPDVEILDRPVVADGSDVRT